MLHIVCLHSLLGSPSIFWCQENKWYRVTVKFVAKSLSLVHCLPAVAMLCLTAALQTRRPKHYEFPPFLIMLHYMHCRSQYAGHDPNSRSWWWAPLNSFLWIWGCTYKCIFHEYLCIYFAFIYILWCIVHYLFESPRPPESFWWQETKWFRVTVEFMTERLALVHSSPAPAL